MSVHHAPGTDRTNMVQSMGPNQNYPLPWENERTTMFRNAQVIWYHDPAVTNMNSEDLAVALASSGYYDCVTGCTNSVEGRDRLNQLLNNAPASFEGVVVKFRRGTYYYINTRNNNFTNRSQRGRLVVR